jgi:hypothetical protein
MADTPQTLALVILAQEYRSNIVRQTNRECQALKFATLRPGSGLNSPFVFEGDGQNAEYYSEGADAANFGSDEQKKGTLQWGLLRANLHVTDLAMDAAATTASPMGNIALWARGIENTGSKLAKMLNQQIYVGDGYDGTTAHVAGLETLIGSLTANVGGIDRSNGANALYRPNVFDPGTPTAITFAQVRGDQAAIRVRSGMNPNIALVSPLVMVQITELFEKTRRYVQNIKDTADGIQLDSSYTVAEIDGTLFMADPDAAQNEGTIYYLNTSVWDIEFLPSGQSTLDMGGFSMRAVDGLPLIARWKYLAMTGASKKGTADISIQQQIRRPNACGVRRNVLVS